ncbi:hypothetical protein EPN28_02890 [Patescibacteria group bacterium]|nr:MAG: hypothetical protein EPN28_02890 [Patescibacteria group bacterium]
MEVYKVKSSKLSGTNFSEVYKHAFAQYQKIKRKTKRRPYIRSAYFNKEKIFLELFWQHLHTKLNHRDKIRRVKYYPCAIELIQNCRFDPISKDNPNDKSEILHRFVGVTKDREKFLVQIKQNKKNNQKWLISVFPDE